MRNRSRHKSTIERLEPPQGAPEMVHVHDPLPDPAAPIFAAAAPRTRTVAEDVLSAIRRRWRTVAAIAALLAFLGWLVAAVQPKRYRANAMAAVTPIPELSASEMIRGVDTLERRVVVSSVAALASAPATARAANARNYDVTAIVLPNTNLFTIEVEGASGAEAAAIANRLPPILSRQSRAMFRVYGVSMLSPAPVPRAPVLPRTGRAAATGLAFGLLAGIGAAYLREQRRAA